MGRQTQVRILFDGEDMQLLHLPGGSDYSLVTFDIMHARANGRTGFAMKLALRNDLDLYAVVPRRPNWYPASEALICAERVAALKDRPSIGYGASMGGYGVLKYGAALRLEATLAMSPQSTIDPADIGDRDPRYGRYHDPRAHGDMRVRQGDRAPRAYAVCDPHLAPDLAQRDLLDPGVVRIDLPHIGHQSSRAMTPSANALARLRDVIEGNREALQAGLLSAARDTLPHAIGLSGADLARGEAERAYRRAVAARRRFGDDPALLTLLARACLATGRTGEGIAALSPLVARLPDQIIYRRLMADLHEADGDMIRAVDHLAHAVAISGNAILSRKLQRLRDRVAAPATGQGDRASSSPACPKAA